MNPIGALRQRLGRDKLSQDIAWTLGSFVVLAASGIVINIVVTRLRDADALGVFNQAYAVYIIVSQFAVWGMHYSVLRHAALFDTDPAERGRMLATAGLCSLLLGTLAACALWLAQPLLASAFDSAPTGRAVGYGALGLILFPLNKVLLAYLNGLRRMKAFSLLQGVRYAVVMVVVAAVAASPWPVEMATFAFAVAEAVTASGAMFYIARRQLTGPLVPMRAWVKKHFAFGSKGLMAGMFAEVNSRIDVLLIGAFLSDRAVGIYSFAAMLVDGLYHVLAMVRINFNPLLVAAMRDGDWAQAQRLLSRSKRLVWPLTVVLSFVVVAGFWLLATIVGTDKGLLEGLPSLVILLAGLTLISALVPFDNLLMVVGHPGYQTLQQLATVGTNAVIAVLLLPVLGIEGAAIGTAASYLAGIIMLTLFAHRVVRWNLLSNRIGI